MCTIVVLHQAATARPLVVAANRDELYARPSSPPAVVAGAEGPRIVAGRDGLHGGTWLGATEHGFFVGITNQRTPTGPIPGLRSRGAVALELLRAGTVDAGCRALEALDPRAYNEFNVIFGDARRLAVGYARHAASTVEVERLGPGIHVLPNDRLGSPEFPKAARAEALTRPLLAAPAPELRRGLAALLADHARPPPEAMPPYPEGSFIPRELHGALQALCIHTPRYGTTSATILAAEPGRLVDYAFAAGPPCRTPFVELAVP